MTQLKNNELWTISPDYPIEPIIKGNSVSAAIFDAIIYVYNKR